MKDMLMGFWIALVAFVGFGVAGLAFVALAPMGEASGESLLFGFVIFGLFGLHYALHDGAD